MEIGIEPILINGTPHITNAEVSTDNKYIVDDILHSVHTQKIYKIIASGTNLTELLCNSTIDPNLTHSNNIIDTYNIFGIEAARSLFINELHSVLKEVAPLDVRHITILIDKLLFNGTLTPANSKGMDHFDNGPLAKASFEKVLYHLHNASISGTTDDLSLIHI